MHSSVDRSKLVLGVGAAIAITSLSIALFMQMFCWGVAESGTCRVLGVEIWDELRYPVWENQPAWRYPMVGFGVSAWVARNDVRRPYIASMGRLDAWLDNSIGTADPAADGLMPGMDIPCVETHGVLGGLSCLGAECRANLIPGAREMFVRWHLWATGWLTVALVVIMITLTRAAKTSDGNSLAERLVGGVACLTFCVLAFVACVFAVMGSERSESCRIVGLKPATNDVGMPILRIWAANDHGGAEFEYRSGNKADRDAMARELEVQGTVMCTTVAYGWQPSRLFVEHYSGTGLVLQWKGDAIYRSNLWAFVGVYAGLALTNAVYFQWAGNSRQQGRKYAPPMVE